MKDEAVPAPASLGEAPSLFLPIGQSSAPAGRIVLSWLIRLRWFAAVGQLVAIVVAVAILGLRYPLVPLAAVVAITALTNAALLSWLAFSRPRTRVRVPQVLTPAVLLLDVVLLTVLLYYTGGHENPFAMLYVLHVAMATLVLGSGWTWTVVVASSLGYGLVAWRHQPLVPEGAALPLWAEIFGQWTALLLVVGVLAYFIGRVMFALRMRESELGLMRERASLNERLASLTTLAAGAAHELGTPLGTIAVVAKEMELEARQLQKEMAQAASLADDAALVRQQVERCRQILEHMRGDIAGRSTDQPGRCSASEVIADVIEQLKPELRSRLKVSLPPDIPQVAVPQRALFQALQFLVNNALEASDPARPVALDVSRDGSVVGFTVTDEGAGMDPETLRRATEPFFTTKAPGHGMGLGLFLVRLVAERNAGSFTIRSAPGRGTRARLELPVADPGSHE